LPLAEFFICIIQKYARSYFFWNPNNREQQHQRIVTNHTISKQRKERETTRFNEVQQFAYVPRAKGERVLNESMSYRLQILGTPSIYSQRSHEGKKTNNT